MTKQEYLRAYYLRNKDKLITRSKVRYLENKSKIKKYHKEYQLENKDKIKEYKKEHYLNNKNKINEKNKQWYVNNKGKVKEYLLENKIKIRTRSNKYLKKYLKNRRKTDINFNILCSLRSRLNKALKGNNKSLKTIQLLGTTIENFKQHLQSKFTENMNWNNYGAWHIDHIKPCASFNLSIPEEQKQCFHYTNLQPLWALENLVKGSKYMEVK